MRNLLITLSLVILPLLASCQDKIDRYTTQYADIAISEMHRSGIPASITLAQGMFESGYGESESALSYNNHFGIKCKKEWTGPYYYKYDDDRDRNGKLIESCFRAYPTVLASYQDHTNFLIERERYAVLFTFHHTDYVNWALGLESCGYATNKMYAERLIEIIERYSLNQYDQMIAVAAEPVTQVIIEEPVIVEELIQEQASIATALITQNEPVVEQEVMTMQPSMESAPNSNSLNQEAEEGVIVATYTEEDLFAVYQAPAKKTETPMTQAITSPVATDTIPVKIVVPVKAADASKNRVNQAIILPSNYKRSAAEGGGSKMK